MLSTILGREELTKALNKMNIYIPVAYSASADHTLDLTRQLGLANRQHYRGNYCYIEAVTVLNMLVAPGLKHTINCALILNVQKHSVIVPFVGISLTLML